MNQKPKVPSSDPELAFNELMQTVAASTQQLMIDFLAHQPEAFKREINQYMFSNEFLKGVSEIRLDPVTAIEANVNFWKDTFDLWGRALNDELGVPGKEVVKKAKELWDGMSVEDQEPGVSKNKSMWEEYYRVNGGGKGKSTRKKNISIPTVEAVEFTEDEEEELEVVLWDYNKKTYLLDEKTGNIYDYETQDIIGTKQGEIVIMINDSK